MISLIAHVDEFFILTGQCSSEEVKRYFHAKTRGYKVVMGLHTMLERGNRPLRDCDNYVFTTWVPSIKIEGFTFLSNLNAMLVADSKWTKSKEEVFIVEGYNLFRQTCRPGNEDVHHHGCRLESQYGRFGMLRINHIRQHEECRAKETVITETDMGGEHLTITEYDKIQEKTGRHR